MRYKHIDAVKGLGIILVVMGHAYGIPHELYSIIYSFHMPLFFIISGLVYNEKKNSEIHFFDFLKKKAKSYLLPYYLYSAINLVIELTWSKFYLREDVTISTITNYIKGILLCRSNIQYMPNCSPIWFFVKYASKIKWLIGILFMAIGYLLSLYVPAYVPLKLDTVFMAVFFMIVGLFIKNCNKYIEAAMFICAIPGIYFALKNGGNVSMNENTYGNLFMFLFASISISLSILFITKKFNYSNKNCLVWLGQNTIPIIGLGYFLREFTTEIYYFIPKINLIKINWFVSFIMTFAACVCVVIIKNFIRKKLSGLQASKNQQMTSTAS